MPERRHDDHQPVVDDFSRDNAADRYSHMPRHQSRGTSIDVARFTRFGKPLLSVLALALVGLFIWAVVWYNSIASAMKPSEDVSGSTVAETFGQPYYVLLLGSDSRTGASGSSRSDTIMLTRVDESKKQVTIVSIPRDTRVKITGHGYSKINAAYAYGGISSTISTVSDFSGVGISYYAIIYFSGFKDLVDELGGVVCYVPPNTHYNGVYVKAGTHKLNGKEALTLARCRKTYATGDYQRTQNQRNLMKAIVKKILQQPAWEIPSLLSTFAKCVETNMPVYKLIWLSLDMKGMDTDSIYSATVPSSSQTIGGVSYVIADETEWKAMMQRVEAGESPTE